MCRGIAACNLVDYTQTAVENVISICMQFETYFYVCSIPLNFKENLSISTEFGANGKLLKSYKDGDNLWKLGSSETVYKEGAYSLHAYILRLNFLYRFLVISNANRCWKYLIRYASKSIISYVNLKINYCFSRIRVWNVW